MGPQSQKSGAQMDFVPGAGAPQPAQAVLLERVTVTGGSQPFTAGEGIYALSETLTQNANLAASIMLAHFESKVHRRFPVQVHQAAILYSRNSGAAGLPPTAIRQVRRVDKEAYQTAGKVVRWPVLSPPECLQFPGLDCR